LTLRIQISSGTKIDLYLRKKLSRDRWWVF
jgi:hypothetical protein